MNDFTRKYIMDRRRNRSNDMRASGMRRRGYDGYDGYDSESDGREYRNRNDYNESYDGKQGVKGTGPYGIGGSMYYGRRDGDYENPDHAYDGYDRNERMHLGKKDLQKWKRQLQNADGTQGEHFELSQIMPYAEKMGLKFGEYNEKELCLAANMLYSDYCSVLKSIVPPEKEALVYTKMAQAFLEDEDSSVDGSEKLAVYYYCIVEDDE